jgi:hypothetical protein
VPDQATQIQHYQPSDAKAPMSTALKALTPAEHGVIEAALAFANLRSIKSNREVEDLFKMPDLHGAGIGNPSGVEFRSIGEDSPEYRDRMQPMLRRWLERTTRSNSERVATSAEVMLLIPRDIRAMPVFSMGRLWYDFQPNSVEAGCALAVALILDSNRGLTSRLQQCTLSGCGRFSIDLTSRARPRKYCSVNHRTLANYEKSPERMRQWRKAALATSP